MLFWSDDHRYERGYEGYENKTGPASLASSRKIGIYWFIIFSLYTFLLNVKLAFESYSCYVDQQRNIIVYSILFEVGRLLCEACYSVGSFWERTHPALCKLGPEYETQCSVRELKTFCVKEGITKGLNNCIVSSQLLGTFCIIAAGYVLTFSAGITMAVIKVLTECSRRCRSMLN